MDTTGEPIFSDNDTPNDTRERTVYVLGIYFFFLFIVFILCYISYICKHNLTPSSPLLPSNSSEYHFISLPEGLPDDILSSFPTYIYSETLTDDCSNSYDSSCSICLAEYKPTDLIRLLPECGHLFHVSCVDTWLKVHPTCPMCRNRNSFDQFVSSM